MKLYSYFKINIKIKSESLPFRSSLYYQSFIISCGKDQYFKIKPPLLIQFMKKAVYTYENELTIADSQFGNIVFSLSKYTDCLVIFINQTGAIGSIIEGVASESTAELAEGEQFNAEEASKPHFVYDIKVLFGSTEIEFYELYLRRVMGIIWEELQLACPARIVMNISLPVLHQTFKVENYYDLLVKQCRQSLTSVI